MSIERDSARPTDSTGSRDGWDGIGSEPVITLATLLGPVPGKARLAPVALVLRRQSSSLMKMFRNCTRDGGLTQRPLRIAP